MAAVLGLLAALSIGVSDLFGRRVVAASSAVTAGATLQLFSTMFVLPVAVVGTTRFQAEPFLWGGVSGVGLAMGIGCYYSGLVRSTSTIVAPMVAALSALVPFAYTAARGSTVGPIQVVGALLVVVGLVLVTGGSVSGTDLRAGVLWAVLSGTGYALGAIGFVEASDSDGWWPAVGQRTAAMFVLFATAAILGVRPVPPKGQWTNGMLTGLATAATSLFYLASLSIDPSIGVVTISAFPAFSVLIGRTFFGDAVRRRQAIGIGLVVVGVAAVSVG